MGAWVDLTHDKYRWEGGCCECGNEPRGYTKRREFLE